MTASRPADEHTQTAAEVLMRIGQVRVTRTGTADEVIAAALAIERQRGRDETARNFHILADRIDQSANEFGDTAWQVTGDASTQRLVIASVHACSRMVREFADAVTALADRNDETDPQ